jgi:hypothetical protein
LSTGEDVLIKASYEDGYRSHEYVRKGFGNDEVEGEGDDEAVDDEEDEEDGEGGKRSRMWSKSMGMGSMSSMGMGGWTKGTKKLLGLKEDKDKEEGYTEGAPLKKSSSTGGFVGSYVSPSALDD